MVLPKFSKSKGIRERRELVSKLQQEAGALFYDKMMYDINDSLTSILAVCDIEAKESVPKVKSYINRINTSLKKTKNYQLSSVNHKSFNISLVIRNLKRVIEDNFKGVPMEWILSDINAQAESDQSTFEELFLFVLTSLLKDPSIGSELVIELRQKDQDAYLTILKEGNALPDHISEEINKIKEKEGFRGTLRTSAKKGSVEITISTPLQFDSSSDSVSKPESKVVIQQEPRKRRFRPWAKKPSGNFAH